MVEKKEKVEQSKAGEVVEGVRDNIETVTEMSEGEMEFMAMHDSETVEAAMQTFEGFNAFVSMLWNFVETIPEKRLHEMLLIAASTSDPELAQTFLDNMVDIVTVIDDQDVLQKAEDAARKTVEAKG